LLDNKPHRAYFVSDCTRVCQVQSDAVRILCYVELFNYLLGQHVAAVHLVAASEATAAKVGERKLFSDLFANYVPEVRPRIDPTQKVNVTADLDLHHIKYLVQLLAASSLHRN